MTINIYFLKFEKVEKIDYNSNSSFECNTESGSKESLSIALGINEYVHQGIMKMRNCRLHVWILNVYFYI